MSTMRKSSVPQREAISRNSGQYESRYQPTVFGSAVLSIRVTALLTRESKMGKFPPLIKWRSVVARDRPNRFFTGPCAYSSVYLLSDQSFKKACTSLPSGHFGNSEAACVQIG